MDANGQVTAVKEGQATITVTTQDGHKEATCVVTVKDLQQTITGVLVPFAGSSPVTAITTTSQFSGMVSWQKKDGSNLSPLAEDEKFDGSSTYLATITLSMKAPYGAADIPANFFAVAGATTTNAAGSLVVTAEFLPIHQYKITLLGVILGYSGPGGNVTVPATIDNIVVTGIGERAFYNQAAITDITLPATVTAIGNSAFYNCQHLTAIEIPAQVKTIDDVAFGYDADKKPASRSYTFRGNAPTLVSEALPTTAPTPTIRYYANSSGYDSWKEYYTEHILAKPTQIPVQIGNSGSPFVTVSWNPVDGATGYEVFCSNTSGSYPATAAAKTLGITANITGLESNKIYYFVVKARDDEGESLQSNEMSANLNIPVSGVSLNQTALDLQCGDTVSLTATVAPADAANQAVTWSSSDDSVVAVAAGQITGKKNGTATITATTSDGSKTASCTVTVIAKHYEIDASGTITKCLDTSDYLTIPAVINGITVTGIGNDAFTGSSCYTVCLPVSLTHIEADAFKDLANLQQVSFGNDSTSVADTAFSGCSNLQTLMYCGNAPSSFNKVAFPKVTKIKYYQGATGFTNDVFGGLTLTAIEPSFDKLGHPLFQINGKNFIGWSSNQNTHTITLLYPDGVDLSHSVITDLGITPGINITVGDKPVVIGITALDFSSGPLTFTLSPVTGGGTPVTYQVTAIQNLSGTVSITGSPLVGQTLTANITSQIPSWVTPGYQWQRKGAGDPDAAYVDINGATGNTYVTTAVDENQMIRVRMYTQLMHSEDLDSTPVEVKSPFTMDSSNPGTITGYIGSGGAVEIPESIGGVTVTGIGTGVFKDNLSLTAVTLPQTLTSIGANAFYQSGITSITIPGSVQSIGENAFYLCSDLNAVNFDESANNLVIGKNAFFMDQALTTITLPARLVSLAEGAFHCCYDLASISFASGCRLTSIGLNGFSGCPITSIALPEQLQDIGDNSFYNNHLTETLIIPEAVISIGRNAFEGRIMNGVTLLSSLEIQSSRPLTIGAQAFKNQPLTTITIPAGVTINSNAADNDQTMGTNGMGFKAAYTSGNVATYQYSSSSWSKTTP